MSVSQYSSVDKFVNAIADGNASEDATKWGPYQFGSKLELKPLERQLRKGAMSKMVATLAKTYTMMFWGVLAAIVFFGIMLLG